MEVTIIGPDPDGGADLTGRAQAALKAYDLTMGHIAYIDLVQADFPQKETLSTGMRREVDCCRATVEAARTDKDVTVVYSDDSSVYDMTGLIYEVAQEYDPIEVEIMPDITAACGDVTVLDAPLTYDFAVVSLSDLLTPWEKITTRLTAMTQTDFVLCLYNPASRSRPDYLQRACDILLSAGKDPTTVCGTVHNIGRAGEEAALFTLGGLRDTQVGMFTTAFVGSSQTKMIGGKMVILQDYFQQGERGSAPGEGGPEASTGGGERMNKILLFDDTGEGQALAKWMVARDISHTVCVAAECGETLLPAGAGVRVDRMDSGEMEALIRTGGYSLAVDATHPYAMKVTEHIRATVEATGLPVLRLVRQPDDEELCHGAEDMAGTTDMLEQMPGHVLLTTGSKGLHHFARPGLAERYYPRMLPMADSLGRCLALGFSPKNIIYMQGPFPRELNMALLWQYHIQALVTKGTGGCGGFREKAEAAQEAGRALLVVECSRRETGLTLEEVQKKFIEEENA